MINALGKHKNKAGRGDAGGDVSNRRALLRKGLESRALKGSSEPGGDWGRGSRLREQLCRGPC